MSKAICLIGFMGCGKTTLGKALAYTYGKEWVDLDHCIEEEAGCSIAELFAEKGEGYFRQLESQELKKVLSKKDVIVSTGGGIILASANRALLKMQSTFYLQYPFETLFNRIQGDPTRPLVTSREEVEKRFEMRKALYEEASTYTLDCDQKTVKELVAEMGKILLNEF